MEPEGSLQPAVGPYPEPDESISNIPLSYLKIRFNIILPSTRRSSKWFLLFLIFDQNFAFISLLSHACCMFPITRSSFYNHIGEEHKL
jgi:hypothetical protein